MNSNTASLRDRYILYDIIFATQSHGKLVSRNVYTGKEYPTLGSKILVFEVSEQKSVLKYMISSDLKMLIGKGPVVLSQLRNVEIGPKVLKELFTECKIILQDPSK